MLTFLFMIQDESRRSKLEQLYLLYRDAMHRKAMSILRDKMEAEDAVQESFIKILSHLDQIDDISSKKTRAFLVTIVENQALDQWRKRNAHPPAPEADEEPEDEHTPEQLMINRESLQLLVNAIDRLDDSYRHVLRLRYLQNMEIAQIASLLNLSEQAVYTRISRGKKILSAQLGGVICE